MLEQLLSVDNSLCVFMSFWVLLSGASLGVLVHGLGGLEPARLFLAKAPEHKLVISDCGSQVVSGRWKGRELNDSE